MMIGLKQKNLRKNPKTMMLQRRIGSTLLGLVFCLSGWTQIPPKLTKENVKNEVTGAFQLGATLIWGAITVLLLGLLANAIYQSIKSSQQGGGTWMHWAAFLVAIVGTIIGAALLT